jgi:uncharacterized protein
VKSSFSEALSPPGLRTLVLKNPLSKGQTLNVTAKADDRFPWGFFALTFGFSWLVWLPGVLASHKVISPPISVEALGSILSIVGLFGPMFAACVLTYHADGGAGLRRHLARLTDFHVRAGWWVVILVLPLLIQAVAHFMPILAHEPVLPSYTTSFWMFLITFILVTVLGGGQEELGWRGYVLERIQKRFNALVSSLILGTFWAFWHLPLWFMPGTSQSDTPFAPFVLVCIALSVIFTWIYSNTGKNMVALIIMHGMVNAGHPLFPVISNSGHNEYLYWALTSAVVAVAITLIWGPATLTSKKAANPLPSSSKAA